MQDIHSNILYACQSFNLKPDCLSSGPINAEIAIIGDYATGADAKSRLPFSNSAGTYLWNTIKKYGLTRQKVYSTLFIKRAVYDDHPKFTKGELESWRNVLEAELQLLPNLKYILILGGHALEGLLHKVGITQWRGSVVDYLGKYTFITLSPSYVLAKDKRTGQDEDSNRQVIFNFDLGKFNSLLQGKYEEVITETVVARTLDDVKHIFDKCRNAKIVSVDIEHLNSETACIGFATDIKVGYVLPFFDQETNLWSIEDELWIRDELSRLFREIKCIGQNFSTDVCWLWYKDRIRVHNIVGDTLLAHHLLYPTLPHNLAFLVSQYTWHPYYKDDGKDWKLKQNNIAEYWKYNAKDTTLTLDIHNSLLSSLRNSSLIDLYTNHVIRILPYLCESTVLGIKIDRRKKAALSRYYTAKFNQKKKALEEKALFAYTHRTGVTPDKFNPSSPGQVAELLYTVFGCPSTNHSTNVLQLNRLLALSCVDEECKEFITLFKQYRKEQKFLSTYANVKIDSDGKFRSHYKQFGTQSAPGRLSSAANQWGTASNIQNQPELSRQMFIAPPGYAFVYIDLSKAEARYVAWRANIESWIEEFERERAGEDIDCHRSLASKIFGIPYDKVPTKDYNPDGSPTERGLGKKARHGLNYEMMPFTFSEQAKIKLSLAVTVYEAYHRETPELKRWWKALKQEIKNSKAKTGIGTLYNAYGRRLAILGPLNDNTLNSAVAFEPQSTIGDHLQRVWYQCHEDKSWPTGSKIILNVHDSLTALSKLEDVHNTAKLLLHYAEQPIDVKGREMIIPADVKVSVPDKKGIHRWSTLKGYKL